ASKGSLTGAWTLNKDLSDKPTDREGGSDRPRGAGGGGGYGRRGGGGGGFGRGGFSGGGMGRGGNRGGNPEDTARLRDAVRDVTNPSDPLPIQQNDPVAHHTG